MMSTTPPSQPTTAEKQGIVVAILGPEGGAAGAGQAAGRCARPGGSLRRTLSADMSSKKWLEQNGFCYSSPMKKIASSKDFSLNPILDSSSSSEDEEEEEEQGENCSERSVEIKKDFDIWSSIVSQKADSSSSKSLPPPYVHPLVKRLASSLSEKSLQICTESLGSETGSDGFSSSSEASDSESECCQKELEAGRCCLEKPREEEHREAAANFGGYSSGRKPAAARTTSFPPPLPSLSSRCGGDGAPTLRMRIRRDNGRLVVEAVSVPTSHKNFAAQRQDGRLVLMFAGVTGAAGHAEATSDETGELEEQFGEEETETEIEIEEDEESEGGEEEEEVVDDEEVMSRIEMVRETRLINFHRLTLMADKRRSNPATAWPKGEETSPVAAASLPPRPRGPVGRLIPAPAAAKVSTTAAASFNHYEYFWRSKITATTPAGGSCDVKLGGKSQTVENDKRQLVVLRGDGFLVSSLKGCCKEPRRTLIWEPRCIATS